MSSRISGAKSPFLDHEEGISGANDAISVARTFVTMMPLTVLYGRRNTARIRQDSIESSRNAFMGMPAQKIEPEMFMEERVARLEAGIEHIQSDVSEIKTDIRGMRGEIKELDQRLSSKIDEVNERLSSRIEVVRDSLAALALTTEKSFAALNIGRMADRVWWLLMSGALLAVMARAFKWI